MQDDLRESEHLSAPSTDENFTELLPDLTEQTLRLNFAIHTYLYLHSQTPWLRPAMSSIEFLFLKVL